MIQSTCGTLLDFNLTGFAYTQLAFVDVFLWDTSNGASAPILEIKVSEHSLWLGWNLDFVTELKRLMWRIVIQKVFALAQLDYIVHE